MKYLSYQQALADFKRHILPGVIRRYGRNDKPARREAWTMHIDSLHRDGLITDNQAQNWDNPY